MNYELAKKLKDAGFPQKGLDDYCRSTSSDGEDYAYEPTLSELIAACGDIFGRLGTSPGAIPKWGASDWADNEYVTGTTPEEAVANLWLALYKKD